MRTLTLVVCLLFGLGAQAKPQLGTIDAATDEALREVAATVRTDPGELPQLKRKCSSSPCEELPIPLEMTKVSLEITGPIVRINITQIYRNPFEEPIEAIYVFPLPENAAVDDLRLQVQDREIRAEIRERAAAKAEYEAAKAQGKTAALLEQERTNIFTQSVANLPPGEAISIHLRLTQQPTFRAGVYEVVFPLVVGPRFIPGAPIGHQGAGRLPDTAAVPDASRITPPILGLGERSGQDLELEATLLPGLPLTDLETPTHQVEVRSEDGPDGERYHLKLAPHDRLPNRDFILRWRVGDEEAQAALVAHRGPKDELGHFALTVVPPLASLTRPVAPREVIFVLDVSGSMFGAPLAQAQETVRLALQGLGPDDTFNVHTFAGHCTKAFPKPRPVNAFNLQTARDFVSAATAGGGTLLEDAVEQALSPKPGPNRFVVFVTDGFVGNEDQILTQVRRLTRQRGPKARVFGVGVGSAPNRVLIEGLGQAGDGTSAYVGLTEAPDAAVKGILATLARPALTDVALRFEGVKVEALTPNALPDLLASAPLVVMGRYRQGGEGRVILSGILGARRVRWSWPVTLPERADSGEALGTLWARAQIAELERALWQGENQAAVRQITELGLRHRLVTAYTSFVVVDHQRIVGEGTTSVVLPVEAPLGVEPAMAAPGMLMGTQVGTVQGFGSVGLMGTGAGGGGFGRRGRGPTIALSQPVVTGSLDREIIRRIIRQHHNEIRYCYERRLQQRPSLDGKLVVSFAINPKGLVLSTSVVEDTLGDEQVTNCVTNSVRRWQFPSPKGGGVVVVRYPFVFKPK